MQSELRSQCPDHDILLETQSQVDSFQYHYPNCTELMFRTLTLQGSGINNVQGISVLNKIATLKILNTQIVNLAGLQDVDWMAEIYISNNPNLVDVSALGYVQYTFELNNNDAIVDLSGLELDSLAYCNILNNDALTTLHGLENLVYIMYRMIISGNSSLQDLKGLVNLNTIYNQFYIDNNDRLKNLKGLENLVGIGYDLKIQNNDSLQSLTGLDNFQILAAHESCVISGNPQLDSCHTEAMCYFLSQSNNFLIQDNLPGCNSKEEVRQLCMSTASDETAPDAGFSIFPNPTEGLFFLESSADENPDHLYIYNNMGQELFRINNPTGTIDISTLPRGLYILKFSAKGTNHVARIVKSN